MIVWAIEVGYQRDQLQQIAAASLFSGDATCSMDRKISGSPKPIVKSYTTV
jgi:hypothetical protein